jgi:hypothetical protein
MSSPDLSLLQRAILWTQANSGDIWHIDTQMAARLQSNDHESRTDVEEACKQFLRSPHQLSAMHRAQFQYYAFCAAVEGPTEADLQRARGYLRQAQGSFREAEEELMERGVRVMIAQKLEWAEKVVEGRDGEAFADLG